MKGTAEVTGVVQIADASETHARVDAWLARLIPFFYYFKALAALLVVDAVGGLAFRRAVKYFEAVAAHNKLTLFLAVVALGDHYKFLAVGTRVLLAVL